MATGQGAIGDAQAFGAQMAYKTIAFDGGAGTGAVGANNLFTVTGAVIALVIGVCTESLVGAGTVEVGTAASTAGIIAQVNAVDLDVGEIWVDASPAVLECWTTGFGCMIGDGADITLTVAGANTTDGTIVFTCFWTPLSGTAYVIAV